MLSAINFIAAGENYHKEAFSYVFDAIRSRAQRVLLGANIRTALIQFTAIPGMLNTVGVMNCLRGFKMIYELGGMAEALRFISEQSPVMHARWFNTDYIGNKSKDLVGLNGLEKSNLVRRVKHIGKKVDHALQQGMFFPVLNLTDMAMTLPAWLGAYHEGMIKYNNDMKQASLYANEKIAEAQPVGRAMDKSYAEYAPGVYRLMNMFSSYVVRSGGVFSARGRANWRKFRNGKMSKKEYLSYVVTEGLLVPLITRSMLLLAWMRPPEEEDFKDLFWEIISVNASGFLAVRDIAGLIQRKISGGFNTQSFSSLQMSAIGELVEDFIYMGKYSTTDNPRHDQAILKGANLLSWAFGLPARRLYNNTIRGIKERDEGAPITQYFIPDVKYRAPSRKRKTKAEQ